MKFGVCLMFVAVAMCGCSGGKAAPDGVANDGPAVTTDDTIIELDDLRERDPAKAVIRINEFLKANPRNDLVWTLLGHAHENLEQNEEAQTAYKTALEINPRRAEALTGLGILHRKKGEYERAKTYYEQSIAVNPTNADAYSSLTVIALKMKDDPQALTYARKGYELDKSSSRIAANLAVAFHHNGMHDERDKMMAETQRLGYPQAKTDVLKRIFTGEMSIRD